VARSTAGEPSGDAQSFTVAPAPVDGVTAPMPTQAPAPVAAPAAAVDSPASRLRQVQEELVAWIKTLFSAAVYALLIVTFGFQVARVEGQSMAHTLEDQDRLIVNKLVYRISEPRRGDIVMLYYPLNPDKSFVKRVIAEEGDSVRIVDGRVYVNDIPLQDDYVASDYRSHDDWGPEIIPEGYYFVMGDHRNNSSDSRHWGMVPKKYIIGKVQLRWWPVPTARVF
jgi:signal peptidase I